MRKLTQQIEMIERIDQLIRLQCTGSPAELAHRLQISKASLYRIIFCMKEMGAPIRFSMTRRSFVYNNDVRFYCGFNSKYLSTSKLREMNGGCAIILKKILRF